MPRGGRRKDQAKGPVKRRDEGGRDESPFASARLVEAAPKPKKAPVSNTPPKPKKPSEIVQGYNPNDSFADILANWEKSGDPYAMPEKGKAAKIASSRTSFAYIFEQWENRGKAAAPKPYERKSEPYKATRSFADILSAYEGPSESAPRKPAKSARDLLREASNVEVEESPSKPAGKQPKAQPPKATGLVQSPSRPFSDILAEYEGGGRKKEKPASSAQSTVSSEAVTEAAPSTTTFFKEMEEDDEIPSTVSWSVFSGARDIERPKAEASEKEESKAPEPVKRASAPYQPKKDFASILGEYEGGKARKPVAPEPEKAPAKQRPVEEEPPKPTFFKEMEEDDEIPSSVSWSVFSGARDIERPKAEAPEKKEEKAPEPVKRTTEPYQPKKDFASILGEYEKSRTAPGRKAPKAAPSAPKAPEPVEEKKPEVPSNVAWSIHGGAREVERGASNTSLPDIPGMGTAPWTQMPEPGTKSFEDLLQEKGDLSWQRRGRTITELRAMMPGSTLDLHGMTSAEAEAAVHKFLKDAKEAGIPKVAVIHGKGLHSADGVGILGDVCRKAIQDSGLVRESYSPKAQYGGSGVLWVILKDIP